MVSRLKVIFRLLHMRGQVAWNGLKLCINHHPYDKIKHLLFSREGLSEKLFLSLILYINCVCWSSWCSRTAVTGGTKRKCVDVVIASQWKVIRLVYNHPLCFIFVYLILLSPSVLGGKLDYWLSDNIHDEGKLEALRYFIVAHFAQLTPQSTCLSPFISPMWLIQIYKGNLWDTFNLIHPTSVLL